jgi:hypothetical protein
VRTVDAAGRPAEPDAEPTARVYTPTGAVGATRLVRVEDRHAEGLWAGEFPVGPGLPAGPVWILYAYTVADGSPRTALDTVEVIPAGDATGVLVSGYATERDGDTVALAQGQHGRLVAGRNARPG